jgi:hypothetical protein
VDFTRIPSSPSSLCGVCTDYQGDSKVLGCSAKKIPSGVRGQSKQSVQSVRSPYGLRTEYQGDSKDLIPILDTSISRDAEGDLRVSTTYCTFDQSCSKTPKKLYQHIMRGIEILF